MRATTVSIYVYGVGSRSVVRLQLSVLARTAFGLGPPEASRKWVVDVHDTLERLQPSGHPEFDGVTGTLFERIGVRN